MALIFKVILDRVTLNQLGKDLS